MTAIWWIRRDLRLHDSPALAAALATGDVIPVFVLDPALLHGRFHGRADRRRALLRAGLVALDAALRERGSRLVLREGEPVEELARLAAEVGASEVFAVEDVSPYARRRDAAVADRLGLTLVPGVGIRLIGSVTKPDGQPYAAFSGFKRRWLGSPLPTANDLLDAPARLPEVPASLSSLYLEPTAAPDGFPAGEDEALRRLDQFTLGDGAPIGRYAEDRDRPGLDGTSALSPYLRFGMLSPRLAAVRAGEVGAGMGESSGATTWLDELIWREFYLDVLNHHPEVLSQEYDQRLAGIAWRNDPTEVRAWQTGTTGIPFVDAAMRQLDATGWMHNRARMVVASFLVKNLLCDWRIGEQWFMDQLVDGDPAANNGGWQWTAGVGLDAAPYFRVFNPVRQGERFDPDGAYVRRWIPELRGLPDAVVHEPWRATEPPDGYPAPIVDLAASRERALEAYRAARAS